jgi:hypothetical protein
MLFLTTTLKGLRPLPGETRSALAGGKGGLDPAPRHLRNLI